MATGGDAAIRGIGLSTAGHEEASSNRAMSETERARELFVRHHRGVNRLVYRLLGPDPEHADIVQDVFVRIVAKAHSLRDRDGERSWVNRVAVNVVRNHLRGRKVRRIVELRATPPETGHLLEPRLQARDLARRGYRMLDQLAAADRIALVLRRIEERPIDEVAELCGCSRATVKRRVARAEKRLASLLEQDPDLYAQLRKDGEGS